MSELSLENAILTRHSIRGFLPKEVPDELLLKVFELAQWSPSGTNVQPWQAYVASGAALQRIRSEFIRRVEAKVPAKPDLPDKGKMGEIFRARRRDCAAALYSAMGVAWEDKPGRASVGRRNFEMFDAPHVVFLCMKDHFGSQTAADVGMYAQTLMLALTANGLASCAQGTMAHYPDLVRDNFGFEEDVKVLFGISFGYEDTSIAANTARTSRAPLEESVTFIRD